MNKEIFQKALILLCGAAALSALIILGCKGGGGDYSEGGYSFSTLHECNDRADNDYDGLIDSWGRPEHCTIGIAHRQGDLGSIAEIFAVGYYEGSTTDVYTITVNQGTDDPGGPAVSWTSKDGDNAPAPVAVTPGAPIQIGNFGLIIFFLEVDGELLLKTGESWTIKVRLWWEFCDMPPDYNCFSPTSKSESLSPCENGVDDDGDGLIDAEDPGCLLVCNDGTTAERYINYWYSESDAFAPVPECNDGIDNDFDGGIDAYGSPPDPECNFNDCTLSED